MPWVINADERFKHCEHLVRDDDGVVLGIIMRFYSNGPTYAWTISGGRIGPMSGPKHDDGSKFGTYIGTECDDIARKRVEAVCGTPDNK